MLTLADMEGNETFEASCLGTADEVVEERVADDKMVRMRRGLLSCMMQSYWDELFLTGVK